MRVDSLPGPIRNSSFMALKPLSGRWNAAHDLPSPEHHDVGARGSQQIDFAFTDFPRFPHNGTTAVDFIHRIVVRSIGRTKPLFGLRRSLRRRAGACRNRTSNRSATDHSCASALVWLRHVRERQTMNPGDGEHAIGAGKRRNQRVYRYGPDAASVVRTRPRKIELQFSDALLGNSMTRGDSPAARPTFMSGDDSWLTPRPHATALTRSSHRTETSADACAA